MPTISTFLGIVIRMYYRDHAPPHFHAYCQQHEAKIAIETGEIIAGHLPRRALALVREWGASTATTGKLDCGRAAQAAERRRAAGVRPMLNKVLGVTHLPGYRLRVEFSDGVAGTVNLSGELDGEMFEPLRDEAMFRQEAVDDYGAVTWPNGADLAPDALYLEIAQQAALSGKPVIAEPGSDG